MNSDSKTMIKVAAGLGMALAVAYFVLPPVRAYVLANASFLVVLVCPVMMLFMHSQNEAKARPEDAKTGGGVIESGPRRK